MGLFRIDEVLPMQLTANTMVKCTLTKCTCDGQIALGATETFNGVVVPSLVHVRGDERPISYRCCVEAGYQPEEAYVAFLVREHGRSYDGPELPAVPTRPPAPAAKRSVLPRRIDPAGFAADAVVAPRPNQSRPAERPPAPKAAPVGSKPQNRPPAPQSRPTAKRPVRQITVVSETIEVSNTRPPPAKPTPRQARTDRPAPAPAPSSRRPIRRLESWDQPDAAPRPGTARPEPVRRDRPSGYRPPPVRDQRDEKVATTLSLQQFRARYATVEDKWAAEGISILPMPTGAEEMAIRPPDRKARLKAIGEQQFRYERATLDVHDGRPEPTVWHADAHSVFATHVQPTVAATWFQSPEIPPWKKIVPKREEIPLETRRAGLIEQLLRKFFLRDDEDAIVSLVCWFIGLNEKAYKANERRRMNLPTEEEADDMVYLDEETDSPDLSPEAPEA